MTKASSKLARAMKVAVPAALSMAAVALLWSRADARGEAVALPAPSAEAPKPTKAGSQTVVFAGGCFWGVQAVFQHVRGVNDATSGYAGGQPSTAHYEMVSSGETGHAESVRVTFDPAQVSFGQLLRVFFSVAHNPTELNRQGPDEGTQYRSAVFFTDAEQQRIAIAYIAELDRAKVFPSKIVTQVVPLSGFYPAEAHHQNFARLHPDNPYIVMNDAPKVARLRQLYPNLYRDS
jgi:peptide-methionine (S)-S-oxide reductase